MSEIQNIKLITETASGTLIKCPAKIECVDEKIFFVKSPFALKDEIKAMKGSHWCGYDEENPRKIWSVTDCPRNRFQLGYLMGLDVYEWFDRDLERHEYRPYQRDGVDADPMPHQLDMADGGRTYHYQIWGAEMGTGKTLSAQMVIETSGVDWWYWVGPAKSIPNMKREFRLWGFDFDKIQIDFMSYEKAKRLVSEYRDGDPLPMGMICDEASRCKNATSQRSCGVQILADLIRDQYQFNGYVIEMSGTPSPKRPTDWWSLCEIAWPGFLKEGSTKALTTRLAFMVKKEYNSVVVWEPHGWKDDERKCAVCGEFEAHPSHHVDQFMDDVGADHEFHKFVPSKNEVAFMYERLKGLVTIKHKKDCLNLPDKRYRKVYCKPKSSVLRVAKALVDSATNAMNGMMLVRELSDGFQYREEQDGMTPCQHCVESCGEVDEWYHPEEAHKVFSDIEMLSAAMVAVLKKRRVQCPACHGTGEVKKMVRVTKEVPCPKEEALCKELDDNEETGRIVVFAGFVGSVDRCCAICRREGWTVVRCDGRGYQVTRVDGSTITDFEPLDFWADMDNPRVAFVAHPESGGMSLTLTEARTSVYWSNSFKPEYRTQSEDRIHRKGMDVNLGCTIVDLIHLPTDDRVLDIIRENRKLELMTMGEVMGDINFEEDPNAAEGEQ